MFKSGISISLQPFSIVKIENDGQTSHLEINELKWNCKCKFTWEQRNKETRIKI